MLYIVQGNQIGAAATGLVLQAERTAEQRPNSGWFDIVNALQMSDAEMGVYISASAAGDKFYDYARDYDPTGNAANTLVTRQYRCMTPSTMRLGCTAWWTYHGITYNISGNTTNTQGGTVTLSLFEANTHHFKDMTTVTGNTTYSFKVYDNTSKYYVVAKEGSTSLGRSDDGFPAGW
jgi:hypothetical protein